MIASGARPDVPALRAEGLVKIYRGRRVVDGVNLEVRPGEVVGLLGPNGAGKSTSFNMVVGMVRPDAGQVNLGDHDVTHLPMFRRARAGIGYLPQEASIFRKLTVRENFLAVLEGQSLSRAERQERCEELLREFGLEKVADTRGESLSGGERRRCEIARSLIPRPTYILFDEPFAGVDPINVGEIQRQVADLKGRGLGVLITDHNVRETLGICDRAYIIASGRILEEGTPAQVASSERARSLYLGDKFRLD
ncbi:LPS export ABC transporter ATP-binding protein [Vulgatibacter incomptus]|uniref:Lipopolysaccharide ABC transporter, ATP-binding protein LptB n=1 Tax=Vulgatibacter incomptus TaxID=1391653 RepID=A0A0K1PGL0_9BACT|nr:LPS export ABC transporter ATP-binding protein [Vulgatibacter incomptus]AKU92234.1 Lipopolysaccharide ABC transporter, ATP-binding protein LptB [Vulgatibacter incomptus]